MNINIIKIKSVFLGLVMMVSSCSAFGKTSDTDYEATLLKAAEAECNSLLVDSLLALINVKDANVLQACIESFKNQLGLLSEERLKIRAELAKARLMQVDADESSNNHLNVMLKKRGVK